MAASRIRDADNGESGCILESIVSTIINIDSRRISVFFGYLTIIFASCGVRAQSEPDDVAKLDEVEVLGTQIPLSNFPGAVTVVDGVTLREAQRRVSLSESLARVPGITVLDRQNYAQDLQVQSRGFGARSTFGIRGIKLIVDGIAASAADGQGQAGSFPLDSLDRIEVLRGPLALQYGNAAGGAIVAHTDLENRRGANVNFWVGNHDSYRVTAGVDGESEDKSWLWRFDANRFATNGERAHSAALRSQLNVVTQWMPRDGERFRLVVNSLSQPETQDPLGLIRQALSADPHGTDAAAILFDTRKSIENHQLALQWERDYAPGRRAWINTYHIERDVLQFLALPLGAQIPASSAGGVIDLGRRSDGFNIGHQWSGTRGAFSLGFEAGELEEARRGYENFSDNQLGVRGRLRRDEVNHVVNNEVYAIGDWRPSPGWSLLGAVRHSRLRFESDDGYFAPNNGDDSGGVEYRETSFSIGAARSFANGEIFASIGRGFETPTVTELAYLPDGGAGFNFGLAPAHFVSSEMGARWRHKNFQTSFALYRVSGEDEIVPADSRGGRASFANAGRTSRVGIEMGLSGELGASWSYALAANWIHARFDESYCYQVFVNGSNLTRIVEEGNRVPGIPRADAYAELMWRSADDAWGAAIEARISDTIAVDDRNTDFANGNARFALRMDWRPAKSNGWHAFIRVDNVFDRQYVGSVIVNEGNSRYFEPGAGRGFTLGVGWNANP